jgi:hypothetical protein
MDVEGLRKLRLALAAAVLLVLLTYLLMPAAPAARPTPASTPSTETAAVATVSHATAVPTSEAAADPILSCTGVQAELGGADVQAVGLTCTVRGAPADDTSFSLRATLVGEGGDSLTIDPLCGGSLRDAAGRCSGTANAPRRFWGGRVSVSGTIRPSGRSLGPAEVVP